MNNDHNCGPLFEVNLKVIENQLTHVPSLVDDENLEGTFLCEISSMIRNINALALLVPRISYFKKDITYRVRFIYLILLFCGYNYFKIISIKHIESIMYINICCF